MARIIPEALWRKSFLLPDGRYDGKKFENLALELLECLYGRGWKPTQETRDGSRDFEKRDRHGWLWAECKAYNERLSVYVISPTLVMALIEEPHTVIVVSRSQLNDNAVRHLAAFQRASGKRIVALDGTVLDSAVLGTGLFGTFFPNQPCPQASFSGLQLRYSVTPDALTEMIDADLVPHITGADAKRPIQAVRYGLIRIDFSVRNLSNAASELKLELMKEELDPRLHIVSFGGHRRASSVALRIPAAGILQTSLILQPREAGERLSLPAIRATGEGIPSRPIKTGTVNVSHLFQIEVVGKVHRRILEKATSFTRNRRKPVVIVTEGASGTGKSRLMLEIARVGLEEGFRCHLYDPEYEDAKSADNVVRDIIADVSELPRLSSIANQSRVSEQVPSHNSILACALYDPKFAFWEHIDDLVSSVISLLSKKPTILIIDNLQFTSDRFAAFVETLILQLQHSGHKNIILVLSLNSDFIPPEGKLSELAAKLRALGEDTLGRRSIYYSELREFDIDDVAEFVSAALSGRDSSPKAARLYEKTLDLLVRKVQPRPLNLWQSLMYLADEEVLSLEDDRLKFSGGEHLLSRLDNIPARLQDLLELRWARIRKNGRARGIAEPELGRTVRVAYLLGNDARAQFLSMGATARTIDFLIRTGILASQRGGFIQFFHSQVFGFFRKQFGQLKKGTALALKSKFQSLGLTSSKFQQYFLLCHFAGAVTGASVTSTVRYMQHNGLTADYWRQYTDVLLTYLTDSRRSLTGTVLTGVRLIGDSQQRFESLLKGCGTLRTFLAQRLLKGSRRSVPGEALFEFYTATVNACLAVYADAEALEVITIALGDLRQTSFENRERRETFLGAILNRKAATLKNFGRVEDALEAGQEALKRFERVADYSMMVETLFDLGAVLFGLPERRSEALKLFGEGFEIYHLHGNAMREPAPCRYPYVRAQLAIRDHDFTTALDFCKSGATHAESVGNSFWGVRLILLEAIALLLMAVRDPGKLKAANESLVRARDWANVSRAERSLWAISYLDGKFLACTGEYARAGQAFSEAINSLALKLVRPEQVAWKSPLLRDIAATCRRYKLSLDKTAVSLLSNGAVQAEIHQILEMPDKTFAAFERRRIPQSAFVYKNEAIESP